MVQRAVAAGLRLGLGGDARDELAEDLAEAVDIVGVARDDVVEPVVVHACRGGIAHVEEGDGGAEEGVVAPEDVEGRDVNDDADAVGELRQDAVVALELERGRAGTAAPPRRRRSRRPWRPRSSR